MNSTHPADDRSPRNAPVPTSEQDRERIVPPEEEAASASSEDVISTLSSETEGIELDQTVFEDSDPVELLHFAPEAEPNLDSTESLSDEESLSFENLSDLVKAETNDDRPPIRHKKIVRYEKGRGVRTFAATIIYLVSVLCVGIVAGMLIVSVVNDVFAFVKDDSLAEITIEDSAMTLSELSEYLQEEGIIRYPFVFRLYVGLKNDGEVTLQEGTFMLSPSYNYDKILTALNPPPVRGEIDITFTEGMTVDDIIDLFLSKGIGTREGFVDTIENYDFDYWFLEDIEPNEDRYYRLEGFLYPDTYRFYTDSSEAAALKKMLDNFKKKVPKSYAKQCEAVGLTMQEAVTLASLIEAECTWVYDYEFVSAVFHNRLNSTSFNGRLDSDATIQYILRHTTGSRKEKLEDADLIIDSPYNTRVYDGLTPGPICNPSLNALTAALYPNTECGYYYFVAQADGYNLYAQTYQQHLYNIKKVEEDAAD